MSETPRKVLELTTAILLFLAAALAVFSSLNTQNGTENHIIIENNVIINICDDRESKQQFPPYEPHDIVKL